MCIRDSLYGVALVGALVLLTMLAQVVYEVVLALVALPVSYTHLDVYKRQPPGPE